MADLALVDAFAGAVDDVVTLSTRDVVDLWRLADASDARAVTSLLLEAAPAITETYGSIAAELGADFYGETRAAAGAGGRFVPVAAPAAPVGQVEALTRWSMGPLFSATPDGALALAQFAGGVERLVRQPFRQTVARNTGADPEAKGIARVARRGACSFCLMLASRVEHVSIHGETKGDRWHRSCKCTPTTVYGKGRDSMPDPAELHREYLEVTAGEADSLNAWRRHVAANH